MGDRGIAGQVSVCANRVEFLLSLGQNVETTLDSLQRNQELLCSLAKD